MNKKPKNVFFFTSVVCISWVCFMLCRNAGALLANIIVYGTGWGLFGTGKRTLNTEQDEWKFMAST